MRQIIDEYAAAIGAVEDAAQRAWAGAVRVRQDPEARPAEKLAALRVMGLADRHRKSFKALRERTLRLSVSSVPSVHSLRGLPAIHIGLLKRRAIEDEALDEGGDV